MFPLPSLAAELSDDSCLLFATMATYMNTGAGLLFFFSWEKWMILFFKFNLFASDEMKLFIFHDLNACSSCRPSQLHLQPRFSFYFFAFKPWARDRDVIFQRKMIAKLPYTIISITNVKAESSQHTFLLSNAILLKLQYFILIFLYFHADTLFFLSRKCM